MVEPELPYSAIANLPATKKLFHADAYARYAQAKVLLVRGPYVVTDQSIFYAESGGQECDHGHINGARVVDVQKRGGVPLDVHRKGVSVPTVRVDTVVVHTLETAGNVPFEKGATVEMEIDWPRRYELMRQHSASHFLYHAAHSVYDTPEETLHTTGCHISEKGARFDFFGILSKELIPEVMALANKLIKLGGDIVMEPEPLTSEIYYWRYATGGTDIIIPCGGTHVRNASELGAIDVRASKKGATTTRVSLKLAGGPH